MNLRIQLKFKVLHNIEKKKKRQACVFGGCELTEQQTKVACILFWNNAVDKYAIIHAVLLMEWMLSKRDGSKLFRYISEEKSSFN